MGTTNNNGSLQGSSASHGGPTYQQFLTFSDTYLYDTVNRLSAVYDNDVNNNPLWARILSYDRYGNMSLVVNSGVPLYGTTPVAQNGYNPFNSATNRLVSGRFDAAGNQTEVGAYSLAYDAETRQTQAVDNVWEGQVAYGYDGAGQRVTKSNNGLVSTLYIYDIFGQLAAEYNSFPKQQSPCATCYLSYDHLGSVRMVTDSAANIISRHDYLPFGEEIPANTAGRRSEWGPFGDKVNQKFTGQERDDETGFDFFQARYFYGAQGRFNSPDPGNAGADLTNPQSWNGYSYVRNNPLSDTDPSGFCLIVSFGVGDNQGQYDSTVPASAAVYPFDNMGRLGGIGSVLSQGLFGPNQSTQALADVIRQNQNSPDGIQLALYSGSAQTFVTGANSGTIDTSNITSVTYLSPGLAPGQGLVGVGGTTAFRGSGLVDFAVTLPARLNSGGIGIQSLGAGTGHNFLKEYTSPAVQSQFAGLTPCGTAPPPAPRMPPPPSIRVPLGGASGFGGWDEFDLLQLINKLPSPSPIET